MRRLLSHRYDEISDYMKTALRVLRKYETYVINAVKYNLSNGSLDGINNKIKARKRITFGYRSFYHFRNSIFVTYCLIGTKNVA